MTIPAKRETPPGATLLPLDSKDFSSVSYYKSIERVRTLFNEYNETKTINEEIVEDFLRYLKSKFRPSSYLTYRSNFLQLLKKLPVLKSTENLEKLEKLFRKNSVKLDESKTDKTFSREELSSILGQANKKECLFLRFLYYSGARVSEMLDSEIKNCKTKNNIVTITVIGKGSKERKLRIPKEFHSEILETFKGKKYLFEHSGRKYTRQYIFKFLKKYKTEEGVSYSPHNFRHSRATHGLLDGWTYKQMKELLGHSSEKTLIRFYDKSSIDENTYFRGVYDHN